MSRSCVRSHRYAVVVIMVMVITLMIVTGSAKAVSVRCAEHLGYRGVAVRDPALRRSVNSYPSVLIGLVPISLRVSFFRSSNNWSASPANQAFTWAA